jgi:FKBP-type peptidyl-prolyl cis-trans isomerase
VVVKRIVIPFLFLALLSCKKDSIQVTSIEEQITTWLDSMSITATRDDSGIYFYSEIENPSGSAVATGDVVAIYYILSDLDGNVIASHQRLDGDSLIFKHGVAAVYPIGVDIAVSKMKIGETFSFVLPPTSAYNNLTSGAINSKLIAHLSLELVGIEIEADIFTQEEAEIDVYISDQNLNDTITNPLNTVKQFPASGISTKRLAAGNGARPLNGDTVVLDYVSRTLSGMAVDTKDGFQFYFGSDNPRPLISGFDFGVSMMQTNERALFMVPSSQAYQESALIIPDFITQDLVDDAIIPDYVVKVKPYTTLLFEVNRVD